MIATQVACGYVFLVDRALALLPLELVAVVSPSGALLFTGNNDKEKQSRNIYSQV